MTKMALGFVLGFLACVWTYDLNMGEAFYGFSQKLSVTHENFHNAQHPPQESAMLMEMEEGDPVPELPSDETPHWPSFAGGPAPM